MMASMASLLMQSVASSVINAITGKGVMRAGKGQEGEILPLLAAPLILKAIIGRGYNKMDRMDKYF